MNSEDLRTFVEEKTEETLRQLWCEVHGFAKTESGEETPEMALRYDAVKEELVEAIIEQVEYNL